MLCALTHRPQVMPAAQVAQAAQAAQAREFGIGVVQPWDESPRALAQARRLHAAFGPDPGLTTGCRQTAQLQFNQFSRAAGATAINDMREQQKPGSGARRAARKLFLDGLVINFTNVQHQLFRNISTSQFGDEVERAEWSGHPHRHLVNKWERAQGGEPELVGYDEKADSSAARKTLAAEARALEVGVEEYAALQAHERMQFAFLDYGQKLPPGGYGKSRFIISPSKCRSDGVVHFGDSAVSEFAGSRGSYMDFADSLLHDEAAAAELNSKRETWIEVQFKGGVALPDDIDRFEVDASELAALETFVPEQLAQVKGAPAAMHEALREFFGDKLCLK